MTQTYIPLLVVALIAFVSPWLSIRLFRGMLPAIVIEIALGFAIGPHGLHFIETTPTVNFLANFAFSYLMFLSGLELDFDLLFERPSDKERPAWLQGLLFFAVTLLVSFAVSFILKWLHVIHDMAVITLLLSTTSVGIVTPALKGNGWLGSAFGQRTLVFALLADMLTLVLFSAYVAIHATGNALSFLLIMVLIACFVFLYRALKLAKRVPFLRVVENATSELGMRASIALILVFVVLSTILGVETIIGAFLAGAIVSLLDHRHSALSAKLNSVGYGFLLPIFFVHVGMQFSFGTLGTGVAFYTALIVCLFTMYANKIIPGLFTYPSFPLRKRIAGGVLLSARLSLVIAASQIGVEAHLISAGMANGLTLVAVLTSFLSPAVFARMMRSEQRPISHEHAPPTIVIDRSTLPDGWDMAQVEVVRRDVIDKRMRHLPLPDDILFVSILRGDERIVPRGYTRLQQYDTIQLMGHPHAIDAVRDLVGPG
ncbi:cation:proton antiporter [Alicyclobacillus acidiphilus]|uniref:cation:proton antiporter n=1 Tax=Alicyclobacillus acidiphilus TaxID=182455 RepID=UPI000836F970|nr:cation:proton antiporter [Alicyclobacillus acidiphilus]